MWKLIARNLLTRPVTEPAPPVDRTALAELAAKVDKAARARLGRSLSIRQVDAGSCNGCELEIHALNNPYYDIERFGIRFVASPRHADVLLVTGPVTANMADLTGHVSALAGLARGISEGLGAPLLRVSAFVFGVRRAVGLRRPGRAAGRREAGMLPYRQAAVPGGRDALAAGRDALPGGRDALAAGSRPAQPGHELPTPRGRSGRDGREEVRS